jgi:hypothetical protein
MGLSSTSAETHDLGLRGTFGATYELDATTLGVFYQTKLSQTYDLDAHVGWQFENDRDYGEGSLPGGGHTNAEVHSWHVGFALTWSF